MSKTRIRTAIRREVKAKTNGTCIACGSSIAIDLHHICPEYANGETTVENLIGLCSNKAGKDSCHYRVHYYYKYIESEYRAKGKKMNYVKFFADWLDETKDEA